MMMMIRWSSVRKQITATTTTRSAGTAAVAPRTWTNPKSVVAANCCRLPFSTTTKQQELFFQSSRRRCFQDGVPRRQRRLSHSQTQSTVQQPPQTILCRDRSIIMMGSRRSITPRRNLTTSSPCCWTTSATNHHFSSVRQRSFSSQPSSPSLYMWGFDDSNTKILKNASQQSQAVLDVPTLVDFASENQDQSNNPHTDWLSSKVSGTASSSSSSTIQQVVCGPTDTAFLLSNGDCYVMGENKQGQLGLGHQQPVSQPTLLKLADDSRTIQQISLGVNFSAVVDDQGDLYTMGMGGSAFSGLGFLGHGAATMASHVLQPKLVESLLEDGCAVQQVQVSELHMTVLTTEGEVLTTGAGSYGRLGNFDTTDQLYLEPVEVLTPASNITSIAGGKSFTLALSATDGVLYSWGRNHKGQLGTGLGLAVDIYAMQAVPEPIEADELVGRRVVQMAAGHSHAACVTDDGRVFFWGMSLHYDPVPVLFQTTHPEGTAQNTEDVLTQAEMVQVACGEDYTLAVDKQGYLYSWGLAPRRRATAAASSSTSNTTGTATTNTTTRKKSKTSGVLGQGPDIARSNQATWVETLQTVQVQQISAGWHHAACLATERKSK